MREIVLDTETTGLDARNGDRIVEIGAVELLDGMPTGETFHAYVNPERPMPAEAFAVHGLGDDFLKDQPVFAAVLPALLEFLAEDRLVIHNASFDLAFLNMEFERAGVAPIGWDRVLDTLSLARRKHPGAQNSLDALCARYGIDNSRRTKHGALLDSEILAEVYLELTGGRQRALFAAPSAGYGARGGAVLHRGPVRKRPSPLPPRLTDEEAAAHRAFVEELGADALWHAYLDDNAAASGTSADGNERRATA